MGDVLTKVMSLINKIAYRRRTLQKKSLVVKHGLWVVISLVTLGIVLGVSWSFVYFKGSEYFSDITKVGATEVSAHVEAKPKGETGGLTAGDEGESSPTPSEIADTIWLNESTRGKNNYSKCEAVGKFNEIGYAIPGDGSYICFDSREEQFARLEKWIEEHREQGYTDKELLCHYSGYNYALCKV